MIGKLDQRITFQRVTETVVAGGGRVRTWSDLAPVPTVWARVMPVRQGEGLSENRMNAAQTAEFTIRNRADLTEKDRIVWAGETWNIRGILRAGSRAIYLTVLAERGVAS